MKYNRLVLIGLPLLFFLLYLAAGWHFFGQSTFLTYPDSTDYLRVAHNPLLSKAFWAADRPPIVPLLIKLLGYNFTRVSEFFLLFSFLSWGVLALAVWRLLRQSFLKVLGFMLVLITALSRHLFFWNWSILSESPSISSFALLLGLSLLAVAYFQEPTRRSLKAQVSGAIILLLCLAFWVLVRDSNAYTLLFSLPLLLFFGLQQRQKCGLFFLILLIGSGGLFFFQTKTSNKRWEFPLVDVIAQRVLPDSNARQYFSDHGMPLNPGVTRFTGNWAFSFNADWAPFGPWLSQQGKSTYLHYLAHQPGQTLTAPWPERVSILDPKFNDEYVQTPLIANIPRLTWVPYTLLLAEGLLVLFLFLLSCIKRRLDGPIALLLVMTLLSFPSFIVCFHGDAMEVPRHCLNATLQLRVGMLLLLGFLIDRLLVKPPHEHS